MLEEVQSKYRVNTGIYHHYHLKRGPSVSVLLTSLIFSILKLTTVALPMSDLEKIKSVTICGNKYKFVVKRLRAARGLTDHPKTKNKTVYIDSREKGKQLLATLIDEFIHCAMWEIRNDIVDQISDDIASALWRCGLRFKEEQVKEQEKAVVEPSDS